jgi:uncharacterized membrane protein
MWWDFGWPMPMPFVFGPMMMFAFFTLCMLVMFFMMRGMHRRGGSANALAILKERFARGEITQTEYDERRRILEA